MTATEDSLMAIEPRIPHDDLVVTHKVHEPRPNKGVGGLVHQKTGYKDHSKPHYKCELSEPDGTVTALPIVFHKGSPLEGWHGWTTAKVIEALIKHMEFFQTTMFGKDPNARAQNELILKHLNAALEATKARVADRVERGVMYDTEKV